MRGRRQADGQKQSIYFPEEMLAEIQNEAKRLDRSLSWVVARCIRHGGLQHVATLPSDSDEAAA